MPSWTSNFSPGWPSTTTNYVICTISLSLPVLYWLALPKVRPGIPYHQASAWNVLGDLPTMFKHYKKHTQMGNWFVAQNSALNSPIVQILFGPFSRSSLVIISDHQEVEDVLVRRFKEFDKPDARHEWFETLAHNSTINMPTDDTFRTQRRMWAGTMSTQFIRDVAAPSIYASTERLVQLIKRKAELANGHAFRLEEDMKVAALDTIYRVTFGTELGGVKSQIEAAAKWDDIKVPDNSDEAVVFPDADLPDIFIATLTLINTFADIVLTAFPLFNLWCKRHFSPRYRKANKMQQDTIKGLLDESREKFAKAAEEGKEHTPTSSMEHVFTREATAHHTAQNKDAFSERSLMDELLLFLLAGYETTSTTLGWGLKYLSVNPIVQSRLRAALYEQFPNAATSPPSVTDLSNAEIPYLSATIAEIQRTSRTAPAVVRISTCDTTLMGHAIAKGTPVMLSITSASYWDDEPGFKGPDVSKEVRSKTSIKRQPDWAAGSMLDFTPERWLVKGENGQEVFDMNAGPSLPFGGGPRGCFGKKLASMSLKLILAQLMLSFEFQQIPDSLMAWDAHEVVTRQPKSVYVRPVERGAPA